MLRVLSKEEELQNRRQGDRVKMGSPISRQVKDQRGNRSNDKPAADSVEESMTTLDYWQSHAQGVGAYPWSARLGLFVFRHSRSFLSFFGPIDASDF